MTIATPLPHMILMGMPNAALIQNAAQYNRMLSNFETLPRAYQYQLLDDAHATLGGYSPFAPLGRYIEKSISQWSQSVLGHTTTPLEPTAILENLAKLDADTQEAERLLEVWPHLARPQRLLALNLSEYFLQGEPSHQALVDQIRAHRDEIKGVPLIPDQPEILEDFRRILKRIDLDLLPNANSLTARLDSWASLTQDGRLQLLRDFGGALTGYRPYHKLVKRIEKELYSLTHSQDGTIADTQIITDIQAAMEKIHVPDSQRTAFEQQNKSLARYQLITRSVDKDYDQASTSWAPSLLLRGPASLMKAADQADNVLLEFGKILPQLWSHDKEEARRLFHQWFQDPKRPGYQSEIHAYARSEDMAQRKVRLLAAEGYDVKSGLIPADLIVSRNTKNPAAKTLYVIVARPTVTPVAHWIQQYVATKESPPITKISVLDHEAAAPNDPELITLLQKIFGRPVSYQDLLAGFSIDVPGYVTKKLEIKKNGDNGISLICDIATEQGEIISRLSGHIPAVTDPGKLWVAWGEDLNSSLYRQGNRMSAKHIKQGMGRRSMQKILSFLSQMGVNALDMRAHWHGLSFMPHIGFDFQDDSTRLQVIADFEKYISQIGIALSPAKEKQLKKLKHAWEVLDFQSDDGTHIGREFFDYYSRVEKKSLLLRFWLRPEYPGWKRLFSRQLGALEEESVKKDGPPEEHYSEKQRQEIANRLSALSQSSLLLDPSIREPIRQRLAEMTDLAWYFLGDSERNRHDAYHDGLTGLFNKKKLMSFNYELEKSTLNPRGADGAKVHWVLMIDIDHFKNINDTHGHPIGDDILRQVAAILKKEAREYDIVARYGGEEFCIVLRHAGEKGARLVAERIRERIARMPIVAKANGNQVSVEVAVSIGAAPFKVTEAKKNGNGNGNGKRNPFAEVSDEESSLKHTIGRADAELYKAKRSGRNRVEYSR